MEHAARTGRALTRPVRVRNFYGSGRANRGNGYRNSMGNNRMMHLSRPVRNLNTLAVGYAASPNDRNILRNGLMGVAQGGIRPPSSAVQQLSGGLISHLPSRRTPILNTERLSLDLEAVMNGNHLGRPVGNSLPQLRTDGEAPFWQGC